MHPPNSPSDDTTPLLSRSLSDYLRRGRSLLRRPPQPLFGAAVGFSRRMLMLREPSVRVRENAAEQFEERQVGWAYSTPMVALDVVWNLSFVVTGVAVLGFSLKERPAVPLRLWIIGYVFQCFVHIVVVVYEFGRRREDRSVSVSESGNLMDYGTWQRGTDEGTRSSVAKNLEYANTMFSFIWWIIGCYWVAFISYRDLRHDSPQLYWLCISFLAIEVFFIGICVAVACLIGLAICCCLPCILGILYAMTDQEGATKEEIERLPNYIFRRIGDIEKVNDDIQESFEGIMTQCSAATPVKRFLSNKDAECCICISAYEDGAELRELPCCHYFHSMCIDKWLYINATCPLCKLNILKTGSQSGSA
ncbi:hypothetical protein K2173_013418 [Erythroxylum novogranatense]|uniref:RING-type E3 ubiquitin transferase n=1 Tax=Erythroxylum novogranatense TaxID=1862640 RepID=A0AAV8SAB3_9ROSI|nr:hypothetical protein K2173_013418 [Erythroxylum novogranatense]